MISTRFQLPWLLTTHLRKRFLEHSSHSTQVLCVYLWGPVPKSIEFSLSVVQSLAKTTRVLSPKNLLCDLRQVAFPLYDSHQQRWAH